MCIYIHTYIHTHTEHRLSSVLSPLSKAEGEHGEEAAFSSHSKNRARSVLKGRNFIIVEVKASRDEVATVS